MKLINQVLRGVVIGIANIIPGVSGGTMMVSMGIYDTLIDSITHLFTDFKRSVMTLLPYLAQGAAMALEDAWVLAQHWQAERAVAALQHYAALRLPRCTRACWP